MSVKNTHPSYNKMLPKWTRCRDVASGADAMVARCKENSIKSSKTEITNLAYIPALREQTTEEYLAYITRAPFYNATWRTIASLNGMLFRKPLQIEVPTSVKDFLEDVTLSGVPFQSFCEGLGEESLKVGRIGVLVDCPTVEKTDAGGKVVQITRADVKSLNIRPTMKRYEAESILNWRSRQVRNKTVLSMVVLKEGAEIVKDEFTSETAEQYRVLDLDESDLYRVRIFTIDSAGNDQLLSTIFPTMAGKRMDFIPFKFISTDDLTPEVDEPPLIDLVDMNIAHWRVSADYEHGCHLTGLPTPYITGYQPANASEKFYLGSATMMCFPSPETAVHYLEFTGDGLKSLEANLSRKESSMAILGARMLEPRIRGVESAEAAQIHRMGEQSMLGAAASTISLGVSDCLKWFAQWAGADGGKVTIPQDFYPLGADPARLTALVGALQAGTISQDTFLWNLMQADQLPPDRTLEDEKGLIDMERAKRASETPKVQIPARQQAAA